MVPTISTTFKINAGVLDSLGIVDANLTVDTPLFIDPMLLIESNHKEFSESSHVRFNEHIKRIITLISQSSYKGDVAWRGASKLLDFNEMSYTCLGYGKSTSGTGFSSELKSTILSTIKEITQLEIDDPELFLVLPLFERGVGADSLSDFTGNIIVNDIIDFNERMLRTIGISGEAVQIGARDTELLVNPYSGKPLLLVARDIIRELPIATCWSDISHVVRENESLREKVNASIGEVFATMHSEQKSRVKINALSSKKNFELLLTSLKLVERKHYDFDDDRSGYFLFGRASRYITDHQIEFTKLSLEPSIIYSKDWLIQIVSKTIDEFRRLVEKRGLWKLLYDKEGKPKHELASQLLFWAVASSFCAANDLDLTPESETGNGPVDFKVSRGHGLKAVVEIKLSTNPSTPNGYENQLEIYKEAEDTSLGFFIVVDVGRLGQKLQRIKEIRDEQLRKGKPVSMIYHIFAHRRVSASKRKDGIGL